MVRKIKNRIEKKEKNHDYLLEYLDIPLLGRMFQCNYSHEVLISEYKDILREFEKRIRKIKNSQISVKYPRELEGGEILLEIKLKDHRDVKKSLDSLDKNREIIEEMMRIFENGIWEE